MRLKNVREGFYRELWVLVFPIVIQNLITSAVTMADVMMLGRVSQTALSASSLAGQVMFLLSMLYFGLASAITILSSQYWGKQDRDTVSGIFGIGLLISLFFSLFAAFMAFFFPVKVMAVWTNVPELQREGAVYLRYAALSYCFLGITQPYLAAMKSCERVKLSMRVSMIALGSNVILNAVLIFGLFGFPAMGIKGAALATTVSRGIEFAVCVYDSLNQECFRTDPAHVFHIPGDLVKDFAKYSGPALVNDMLWALAYNMNSVIMGHLGSDIVAANSVVTVARDLITTVGFGIASASSILLGREIGENNLALAEEDAKNIFRTSLQAALVQGVILFAFIPVIPNLVILSDTAAGYLRSMLLISCVYQVGQILNTLLIASFFRCGGDSRYGLFLDLFSMWGVSVPLALFGAFVLRLPPLAVYCLMCLDEFVKLPFALYHYRHGTWIRNLTREFE